MTRKDYVMLGDAIRAARHAAPPPYNDMVADYVAEYIATRLEADNARFDRSRFLRDAGVVQS